MCQGSATIQRNESVRPDEETTKRALEKGKERLQGSAGRGARGGDPEAATKQALDDRRAPHRRRDVHRRSTIRSAATPTGKGWVRALRADKGIKFKEIWVQHRDESVDEGQVAIYFFPTGSAEKAVVEVTDGSETFSVLVYGLTGRVELKDGELRDVNDHMLRNVLGDKDEARREERSTMKRARLHAARGDDRRSRCSGSALVVLIKSAAGNIFSAEQAHMMGIATDLARGKMYDIEEILLKDGFTDTDQSQDDEKCFDDEGWPTICYSYKVEEPKLPSFDQLQAMAQKQARGRRGSGSGSGSAGSAAAAPTRLGGFENSALGGMLGMMGGRRRQAGHHRGAGRRADPEPVLDVPGDPEGLGSQGHADREVEGARPRSRHEGRRVLHRRRRDGQGAQRHGLGRSSPEAQARARHGHAARAAAARTHGADRRRKPAAAK